MDWRTLTAKLVAEHPDRPQEVTTIELAVREIAGALGALARCGHHFHLAEGLGTEAEPWPKVMFHARACRLGRVVLCEAELAELGEGWRDTLAEADRWSGMRRQFMGRGGIRASGLPAPIEFSRDLAREHAEAEARKAGLIAAFKARQVA